MCFWRSRKASEIVYQARQCSCQVVITNTRMDRRHQTTCRHPPSQVLMHYTEWLSAVASDGAVQRNNAFSYMIEMLVCMHWSSLHETLYKYRRQWVLYIYQVSVQMFRRRRRRGRRRCDQILCDSKNIFTPTYNTGSQTAKFFSSLYRFVTALAV